MRNIIDKIKHYIRTLLTQLGMISKNDLEEMEGYVRQMKHIIETNHNNDLNDPNDPDRHLNDWLYKEIDDVFSVIQKIKKANPSNWQ